MKTPSIKLSREDLAFLEDALQKEWLVTNGLGGYASSTVLGINTRKYHGLLVAALNPPKDRRVYLAKLDEDIVSGNSIYRLGANEFKNGFFPQGYYYLKEFSVSPFPRCVYEVHNIMVEKTVFMPFRRNSVIVVYCIMNDSDSKVKIQIYPIISGRRFHAVIDRAKTPLEFAQRQDNMKIEMSSLPQPVLMMSTTGGRYTIGGRWIESMYLREEARRGESFLDDCYQPGNFEITVDAGKSEEFAITAVADGNDDGARHVLAGLPSTIVGVKALCEEEARRRESFVTGFYSLREPVPAYDWTHWLLLATDAFVVGDWRGGRKSVIAGYHWFEAWGRDTFISLPGLTLITGRFDDAREILSEFKKHCKQGLIPNFLPEQGEVPVYNAVDAALWYVNAALQYLKYTNDFKFIQEELWDALKSIVYNQAKGTTFGIHVDTDGLLAHGPQCTWMDANADEKPVTPRAGKAVEVQALWFNALKTVQLLSNKFGERSESERFARMAEKTRKSFSEKFWNAERDCLFDVLGENDPDGSLRPNQILSVALDFTMLDNAKNKKIIDAVQHELLTSSGLRTLERRDPRYVGVYSGNRESRDRAYHNGTVWPWLLGPFTTAFLKNRGHVQSAREYAWNNFLAPLFERRIYDGGLGALSEIYDAEPPHAPRGCIAQAWSVAEPLRSYIEDVLHIRPRYEREVLQLQG